MKNKQASIPRKELEKIDLMYSMSQFHDAIKYIKILNEKFPNQSLLFNLIGACYKGIGQLDGAVQMFRIAVSINPKYAEAFFNLGATLQALDQKDDAVENYQKAIDIIPNYPDAHNNLGNTLLDLGQIDSAIESLEWAVAYKHDFAEAYNNLGNAYNDSGKPDKAIENFNNWDEAKQGIYLANDLIISKKDLVTNEEISSLKKKINEFNFEKKIFYSENYNANDLLKTSSIDDFIINNTNNKHKQNLISKKIKTIKFDHKLTCTYEGVVMWMDLISIFKSDRILRSKSILNINGKPAVLESVRQVFHPIRYLDKWPYKDKTNKFFFVCQKDINKSEIVKSLDCLDISVKKNSKSKLINQKDFMNFKSLFAKQNVYR